VSDEKLVQDIQRNIALDQGVDMQDLDTDGNPIPKVGDLVIYQTDGRNDLDYHLPAIVSVTQDTHPGDYPDGSPNSLGVPSSPTHVHITVLTPGGFGSEYTSAEGETTRYSDTPQEELPNLGKPASFNPGSGTYVEQDVPFGPNNERRSWRPM
jgi:hypothetical protein